MNCSAVVLDLDGTLLNSEKTVSARSFEAVRDCYMRGMKIIFATARPPRAVKALLPEEFIEWGSFIYYNGAYTQCRHTGIDHHDPIEASLTAEVLRYCLDCEPDLDISLEIMDVWLSHKIYPEETLLKVIDRPQVMPVEELMKREATKILYSGKVNPKPLIEKFGTRLNILVTDNGSLVQISSTAASKENALTRLCERLDIPLEHVAAFGDDYNDIGLFQICGWPVAMGNAVHELKSMSKEITDSNDRDGVALVLERLLLEG
ncbi:putative phosphatase YwpJ [compost metagenome]